MRKYLSIISGIALLLISFINAHAQYIGYHAPTGKKGYTANKKNIRSNQYLHEILQKQYIDRREKMNGARTSSVTAERLKSFCGYQYLDTAVMSGGKSDSVYYLYSGDHGSVFNYQRVNYLAPNMWTNTSPVDAGSNSSSIFPQNEMYPDSAFVWNSYVPIGIVITDTFGYQDIIDYSYSGSNTTETGNQYVPTLSGLTSRYNYYYDGTGKLTFVLLFDYNSALFTWDTTNAVAFFYNGLGQLVMDSSSVNGGPWTEDGKQTISYNASGLPVFTESYADSFGYWIPDQQRFFYYNSDNTLHTDSVSQYNLGSWTSYTKDSFGYTTGVPYFTYGMWEEFLDDTVYYKSINSKHVSAMGLPDTVYIHNYNAYPSSFPVGPLRLFSAKKVSFTYDSYSNPLVANDYGYTITDTPTGAGYYNTTLERVFYYYYETYLTSASVQNIAALENITIYPNPSTNEITISRPDAHKGAYTLITLANAMGQTVRTEGLPWMNVTETFSLAGLVPGMYVLTVRDNNGNTLTTQKIIRQ